MSETFDPYRKWLGILPKDQPPHHYRLLGIATFENDPDVIENAANRQMTHVRTFQGGRYAALSQKLLTELSAAKLCLLVPAKKQKYDAGLRERLETAGQLSSVSLAAQIEAEQSPVPQPDIALPPMPGARTTSDSRWKTENELEASAAAPSPPVPIPMPTGTVAVAAPSGMPVVKAGRAPGARRGAVPTHRARKQQSSLPATIIIVSLIVLVAGGAIAAVVFNMPRDEPAPTRSKNKPSGAGKTPIAGGVGKAAKSEARPSEPSPAEAGGAAAEVPTIAIPLPKPGDESAMLPAERVNRALHFSRRALAERDDKEFDRQIALAEQELAMAGNLPAAERTELEKLIGHQKELKQLVDQFWQHVRETLTKGFEAGAAIDLHDFQMELVSFEGDVLEYKLNDQSHRFAIRELDPTAAALLGLWNRNAQEPATLLPVAAFLSVDSRAVVNGSLTEWARVLFHTARLAGGTNAAVAQELRLKLE